MCQCWSMGSKLSWGKVNNASGKVSNAFFFGKASSSRILGGGFNVFSLFLPEPWGNDPI